jgi:hypothetical protein
MFPSYIQYSPISVLIRPGVCIPLCYQVGSLILVTLSQFGWLNAIGQK